MAEWLTDRYMKSIGIEEDKFEDFRAAVAKLLTDEGAW